MSHLPVLLIAGAVIAIVAVLWTLLLERQAKAKRERIKARQEAIKKDKDK